MNLTYSDWCKHRIAERASEFPAPNGAVSFSLLTTVYENTNTDLFEETARNLFGQSFSFSQWVILAHGTISDALNMVLDKLALDDARIEVFRLPTNLGIMGGMRFCMERASDDYLVPMDADDLLTPDALQVLASVIQRDAFPAYLYSDEDMLIGGKPKHPYWRPDWDPVLNLASSYIWHLTAIRRDVALALDLYSDSGADFCHDWDTVFRVAEAGYEPVHIAEPLYHWRQHEASSTHKPDPDSGSRRSTRRVLERVIAAQEKPENYRVEDFPIFRGAPEWHIGRNKIDSPGVAALIFGAGEGPVSGAPFSSVTRLPALEETGSFFRAAEAVDAPYIMLASGAMTAQGDDWFWEAVKLFELHPQAALVQGLILNAQGDGVQAAGASYLPDGEIHCPQAGRPVSDPGPFALYLKPQQIAAATTDCFFVRTEFALRAARGFSSAPAGLLGALLGCAAQAEGASVAFSPLIRVLCGKSLIDDSLGKNFFDLANSYKPTHTSANIAVRRLSATQFITNSRMYIVSD